MKGQKNKKKIMKRTVIDIVWKKYCTGNKNKILRLKEMGNWTAKPIGLLALEETKLVNIRDVTKYRCADI